MYHPNSLNHLSVVRPYEKWTAAEVDAESLEWTVGLHAVAFVCDQ